MSPKNGTKETTILVLAFLVTVGLVGAVFVWILNNPNIQKLSSEPEQSQGETFAQLANIPSGLFRYGGSTTWAPIRKEVDSKITTVWPKFELKYTDPITGVPGSSTGIKMVLKNQLAFSQSSRSLKVEEYQEAKQRGFSLKEIPVALDGIAIAVNPNLDIPGLTIAQLKDIYTGQVTNWSQLGGSNLPIIPYSRRPEEGGTVEFFYENILGEEKFAGNIKFIPTTTEALRKVAKNTGGIYYASAPEVVGQCGVKPLPLGRKSDQLVPPYQKPLIPPTQCPQKRNQLNPEVFISGEYPITRRLFVIVKQNGQTDQQAGEAYANLLLTNQGQELISKAGFVRIR
ncbi:MAG: PstS family phosphate ABC transporter substrate-binding protein [Nostocaceae cyanobacterium]|nr:PstS family phosphate ABC transporter substrate-binding protein [Nostocaceae cyanobacterium]